MQPDASRIAEMAKASAIPAPQRRVTARLTRSGPLAGRSAPTLREDWILTFPARWGGRADPMTGWWGQGDPLQTITLRFADRQSAEAYVRREGLLLEDSGIPSAEALEAQRQPLGHASLAARSASGPDRRLRA